DKDLRPRVLTSAKSVRAKSRGTLGSKFNVNNMDVKVKFLGGAESVTGSRYLITIGDFRFLFDCGLFQGLKDLRLRNRDEFPVDVGTIDAIIISHAHIDHSGYLPKLV